MPFLHRHPLLRATALAAALAAGGAGAFAQPAAGLGHGSAASNAPPRAAR